MVLQSLPCHQVKTLPPLVGRLVPFMAVAAGNSINIPLMRRMELTDGECLLSGVYICPDIYTPDHCYYHSNEDRINNVPHSGIMLESAEGEKIGESKIAARQGISMVILSRIGMATPGMVSSNPCPQLMEIF